MVDPKPRKCTQCEHLRVMNNQFQKGPGSHGKITQLLLFYKRDNNKAELMELVRLGPNGLNHVKNILNNLLRTSNIQIIVQFL